MRSINYEPVTTLAFLITVGDQIRHKGVRYRVDAIDRELDEVEPGVTFLVLAEGTQRRRLVSFQLDDYVARVGEAVSR